MGIPGAPGDDLLTDVATANGLYSQLAWVGFAVAAIMLFCSILVLLQAVEQDVKEPTGEAVRAARLVEKSFVLGVCPLAIGLFVSGVRDHVVIKYGAHSPFRGVEIAGYTMLGAMLLAGPLLLGLRGSIRRLAARTDVDVDGHMPRELLAGSAVAIALASVLVTGFTVTNPPSTQPLSDYVPLAELAIVTIFCFSASVAALRLNLSTQAAALVAQPALR